MQVEPTRVVWSKQQGNRKVEVCTRQPVYIEQIVRFYEDGVKVSGEVFLDEKNKRRQIDRFLAGARS